MAAPHEADERIGSGMSGGRTADRKFDAAARQAQTHLDLVVALATSRDGAGKKSSTIRALAVAPLVYLTVLLLIQSLAFPPVAGADDANLFSILSTIDPSPASSWEKVPEGRMRARAGRARGEPRSSPSRAVSPGRLTEVLVRVRTMTVSWERSGLPRALIRPSGTFSRWRGRRVDAAPLRK
jgi:hypothetical protein